MKNLRDFLATIKDNGRLARLLARSVRKGALGTALEGRPYVSLAAFATDAEGRPIFLFSKLSDHTKNLEADAQAALLIDAAEGLDNPQEGPRVTLMGRVTVTAAPEDRARFLARHPAAAMYADFGDFRFFKMDIDKIHFVGGFARAVWLEPPRYLVPAAAAAAIAAAEAEICAHMNQDHGEALALYANRSLERPGPGWVMTGADADGIDLARGAEGGRIPFPDTATNPGDIRNQLINMAKAARESGR